MAKSQKNERAPQKIERGKVYGWPGRLMPIVRQYLWAPDGKPPAGWSEIRECSILKRLLMHRPEGRVISALRGLVMLRDAGEVSWLKPGQKITSRALYNSRCGVSDMFHKAEDWYCKGGKTGGRTRIESLGDILERSLGTKS